MSQHPTYIQLEPGEEVSSVRDRLSFLRGQGVLLIWPESGTALTRKLDLVLVQREARRRAIKIALVTHDTVVVDHARNLGISTFETIQEAENNRWKRGRSKVFTQRHHKPMDEPGPEDLMPVASRVRRTQNRLSGAARIILRVVIVSIVFGVIAGTLYITVPSAEITLQLAYEPISIETSITADPAVLDVDVENAIIPAAIVRATVQTIQQVETTGIEIVDDRRAIGVATFTNQTADTLEISAGTLVSTSTNPPVTFQTTLTTRLRGGIGERAEVAIEATADSTGSIGNVTAGAIDTVLGPLQGIITVRNLTSTLGGESQSYRIVTEDDRLRLEGIVRGQLQSQAYSVMEESLSESQVIVLDTIYIPEDQLRSDWTTYSHQIGERSDTLSLSMRTVVEAMVIDDRFARQIVFARLSSQKPDQFVLDPASFIYTRGPVISASPDGQIVFESYGDGLALAPLDTLEVQQQITGMTTAEAQAAIAQMVYLAEGTIPQIQITPGFITNLPLLAVRIHIEAIR